MKVLMTHELFMPDFHGGGEKIVYEITKGLINKGVEVTVLTTGDSSIKSFEGIPTIRLPVNRYLMNFAYPWILKHAKDFDIIQTNNYNACLPSLMAGRKLNKPVFCIVHGMYGDRWYQMRGRVRGYLSKQVEKFQICRDYDRIIFLSDFARDQGLEVGIPRDKTCVIHPGLEFENYKMGDKKPFVLFVGRLAKQKGLEYLIKAARELPDITFKFAGHGEEEVNLKLNAPINVEFLGFVSTEDLYDLYSEALVFCLPSVAETFGVVILEAMASGCAIVSTVSPVEYKGFKVKVGDVEALQTSLKYLIDNPEKAVDLGRENRKIAQAFTWKSFTERLIDVYSKYQ